MAGPEEVASRYAEAVFLRDEVALLALYDEDVLVFDLWDRWAYQGREAWSGMIRRWFSSLGDGRIRVSFTPLLATVKDDRALWCALVRYADVTAAGDEIKAMTNRISWWLERRGKAWRIVHEHTSAPTDAETLLVRLDGPADP